MKKAIKIIGISVIVFLFISLSVALTVSLRRKNTLDTVPKGFITDELSYGDYSFEIIQKKGFYYPTLSGYVVVKNKPVRITVVCNDSENNVEMQSVKYKNGFWVITFNDEIIYNYLSQGEHSAIINVYGETENTSVNAQATLVADDNYFVIDSVCDFGLIFGENELPIIGIFPCMDKESNWAGPY